MALAALAAGLACAAPQAGLAESLRLPDIRGPQVICFKYSAFRLAEGERVEGLDMGLESLALTIAGPGGRYTLQESEIWGASESAGRRVLERADLTAFEDRGADGRLYDVWGQTYFSAGRQRMLVQLSGPALRGAEADRPILERLMVGDPGQFHCNRRYVYTMDADGPEEP